MTKVIRFLLVFVILTILLSFIFPNFISGEVSKNKITNKLQNISLIDIMNNGNITTITSITISVPSIVKIGQSVTISVKTGAGLSCKLTVNSSLVSSKTSNSSGVCSWNWSVKNIPLGTCKISVYNGYMTQTKYITVKKY
jgi:hypothetical protein